MFDFGVPGTWYVQVFVPVSHCKDTHNFEKTNNLIKIFEKIYEERQDLSCLDSHAFREELGISLIA